MEDPSSPSSSSPPSETFLVGFVIVNIVGLKYYSGTISGREMVALVREPLNPYDPNAIKVLNTRTVQVGHIERSAAAVLAPLIDASLIVIEGIVPKPPKNKSPFRLPCQIHIFASPEEMPTVRAVISSGGLELISEVDHAFALSDAVVVKERNPERKGRSIDKIFTALETSSDKNAKMKIEEPPNNIVKSELFLHQKEALGWLVYRENSAELPPFWEEKDGAFTNVLTNYQTKERPEPLRGGIFADDMGLGKTLTMISLIATNRYISDENLDNMEENGENSSVSAGKRTRTAKKGKIIGGSKKKRKLSDRTERDEHYDGLQPKSTLIVCPLSVFSTWTTQLEEHTKRGCLRVYLYYGERTSNAEELRKYDIVLTTYNTLASELEWTESPINEIEWLRVILDEAHVIKNVGAKQSEAVINLRAKRRWAVTGTPIQNGSFDLFSLMAFLRFQPFSIKSYWQSLVQRPLDQGKASGLTRLQVLMGSISLRRTKDSSSLVGLLPKVVQTCFVELSAEEREQYDRMESEAKQTVKEYICAENVMRNYSTILHIILRLRQICNDVALCPSDIRALLPQISLEDVSNNPELLLKMVSILQDGDDFDCPICLSLPTETVITCCAHIFCQSCILKTLKNLNPRCPICRHALSKSDLFLAPSQPQDDGKLTVSSPKTSSKVSALLKFLIASREENPRTKSVIFSQFRKMLILLEEPLRAAGFVIVRLDGSMNAKKRAQVIKEFGEQGEHAPNVLLASLKAAGAGINLTAASRLYMMEPWWNPAVEEQAMDRVHRIGQKEEVQVVRMVVKDSIEERVLKLQEKKKNLAKGAFERKGSKEQKQINVEDLRAVMSL
ncbi:putative SWI/SNF-related matrix-associated actin-dependent regulator of chromatin subfamily A member 3-like 1 [Aristolochia californica]|uniref:putative SWI/SNF-related matrix-associated actin-dependent regulator of chromatin subfamily A member 3-like 1 n=1 Tax=Aristolochia californica TaxID=171875 RepID=UPI0035D6C328